MSTLDKEKQYELLFTLEDLLDVRLLLKGDRLRGFVLSYRAKIAGNWYEVFRVDTCHEYLHMQKFWESPEPIPLRKYEQMPLEAVFQEFTEKLRESWRRYRSYMEGEVRKR